MDRLKTLFKYFLIFVFVLVFSFLISKALLRNSYQKIRKYEINVSEFFVDVEEAKVSKRNGYIKGIIKNNTNEDIENKYLKFTMISDYDTTVGEKYVKVDSLKPNELKGYEVSFEYENVKTFKIGLTDTIPEEEDFFNLIKENIKDYKLLKNGDMNFVK